MKTKNPDAAKAMKGRAEHALFRITSGDLAIPPGVDAADFIVWGDAATEKASRRAEAQREIPSLEESIEPHPDARRGLEDDAPLRTERSHLRNLKRCLNSKAHLPIDRLSHDDLGAVLRKRLEEAEGTTVKKERQTFLSFFDWAAKSGKLKCSPATDQQKRHGNSSLRLDEVIVSKPSLPGCKMRGQFVYGEAGGVLIFLEKETAETLSQLGAALATAPTWGELRGAVGDGMTAMLLGIAELTQYPGDQAPFHRTPIVRDLAESWSVDQLLEPFQVDSVSAHAVSAGEVPVRQHLPASI